MRGNDSDGARTEKNKQVDINIYMGIWKVTSVWPPKTDLAKMTATASRRPPASKVHMILPGSVLDLAD